MSNDNDGLDYNINISNSTSQNQRVDEKTKTNEKKTKENTIQNQSSNSSNSSNSFQNSANPCIVFFTLFFKILSIIIFIFGNFIFKMSDSLEFVFVVIFSSLDFWFIKNVSRRILVGLRYWNEIKQDGSEVWVYENENEKKKSSIDTKIFWGSIYLTPCFWFLLIPVEFFSFNIMNFLECVISFVLTFSNLYGYYKCSKEQNKKIRDYLGKQSQKGITNIISSMTNK